MSLISGDVFLLLPIYRYHETWDFLTHEKNMHNSLWNLIHMPICTHARIFSDFNLSFRFLTKKINRGTNNRSNTTAKLIWGGQIFPWRSKESQQCDTKPAGDKKLRSRSLTRDTKIERYWRRPNWIPSIIRRFPLLWTYGRTYTLDSIVSTTSQKSVDSKRS